MIITVFIVILVGVIFVEVIAQEVGTATETRTILNTSLDTVVNGTAQYFTGYRALSDISVFNETNVTGEATNLTPINSGNYTITNNIVHPTTGALTSSITPDASDHVLSAWVYTATGQPTTYIAESGARAIAGLIVLMFALAVAIIALTPTLQSKLLESFGR